MIMTAYIFLMIVMVQDGNNTANEKPTKIKITVIMIATFITMMTVIIVKITVMIMMMMVIMLTTVIMTITCLMIKKHLEMCQIKST